MKKNTSESPEKTKGKGAFYKAGEVIGSIGFHIVDGKNKAVGVVSDGFNILKEAIKKKPGKKPKPKPKIKKVAKKKLPAKSAKKATKGVRKKAAKKSQGENE